MVQRVQSHHVIEMRILTKDTFVLRLDRQGLSFRPGQHIAIRIPGDSDERDYSIYSGVEDDFLEILVKEVPGGSLSPRLRHLKAGDEVFVEEPSGVFVIDGAVQSASENIFIVTGTGIAPFHCFAKSYPRLNYKLIHGTRFANEHYDRFDYPHERYVQCVTEGSGDFAGRVTTYLKRHPLRPDAHVYLCGNANMIYEALDILEIQGVKSSQVFSEVYF